MMQTVHVVPLLLSVPQVFLFFCFLFFSKKEEKEKSWNEIWAFQSVECHHAHASTMDNAREKMAVFNKKKKVSCCLSGEGRCSSPMKKETFCCCRKVPGRMDLTRHLLSFLKKKKTAPHFLLNFRHLSSFQQSKKRVLCVCVLSGLSHLSHNSS